MQRIYVKDKSRGSEENKQEEEQLPAHRKGMDTFATVHVEHEIVTILKKV